MAVGYIHIPIPEHYQFLKTFQNPSLEYQITVVFLIKNKNNEIK
jgi:hypothetical protein